MIPTRKERIIAIVANVLAIGIAVGAGIVVLVEFLTGMLPR